MNSVFTVSSLSDRCCTTLDWHLTAVCLNVLCRATLHWHLIAVCPSYCRCVDEKINIKSMHTNSLLKLGRLDRKHVKKIFFKIVFIYTYIYTSYISPLIHFTPLYASLIFTPHLFPYISHFIHFLSLDILYISLHILYIACHAQHIS